MTGSKTHTDERFWSVCKPKHSPWPQCQVSFLSEANYPRGVCWSLFKILLKTKKLIIQPANAPRSPASTQLPAGCLLACSCWFGPANHGKLPLNPAPLEPLSALLCRCIHSAGLVPGAGTFRIFRCYPLYAILSFPTE